MSESYKLCHRCHLSGSRCRCSPAGSRGHIIHYYYILCVITSFNAHFIVIAFIMIYNIHIYTEVFFPYIIYDGVRMTSMLIRVYPYIICIHTNGMNGKITRARRFSSFIYMCILYNITTTLFFGMSTVYTDVCGDLDRAYD